MQTEYKNLVNLEFLNLMFDWKMKARRTLLVTTSDESGAYSFDGANLLPGTHVIAIPSPDDGRDWRISTRNAGQVDSRFGQRHTTNQWQNATFRIGVDARSSRNSFFATAASSASDELSAAFGTTRTKMEFANPGKSYWREYRSRYSIRRGTTLRQTHTNSSGIYQFNDVVPGRDYSVQLSRPDGTRFSSQQPGADSLVSSINPSTQRSDPFRFDSGSTVRKYVGIFGAGERTGITGVVWDDLNGNGIQDADEQGLAGVLVHANDEEQQITTVTTNSNGEYLFDNLETGSYSLEIKLSNVATFSPINRVEDDFLDSDVNRSTGRTKAYPLLANQLETSIDFGIYRGPLFWKRKGLHSHYRGRLYGAWETRNSSK